MGPRKSHFLGVSRPTIHFRSALRPRHATRLLLHMAVPALLIAIGLSTGACSRSASPPGSDIWGIASATLAPEQNNMPVAVEAVRLAPRNAERHNPAIEAALVRSLGFRHLKVHPNATPVLRYARHTVPEDSTDDGPSLLLDGSIGQHGQSDLGVEFDFGLFPGGNTLLCNKEVREAGFFGTHNGGCGRTINLAGPCQRTGPINYRCRRIQATCAGFAGVS